MLDFMPAILSATGLTLQLMLLGLVLGGLLAVTLTLLSVVGNGVVNSIINSYIFVMRGTPLLVQIYLIYFGLGYFEWVRESIFWVVLQHAFWCAVIALALNSAAYSTVLFKGAIKSIPKGEIEACMSLGMARWQALTKILIPRAMRIALPSYSNEIVIILKSTSLASAITLLELTGAAQKIISQTYMPLEYYALIGVIYLALNVTIIYGFRLLERKYCHYKLLTEG